MEHAPACSFLYSDNKPLFLFALYCNLLNAIALNYALWQGRDILVQVFRVQS